VYGPAKAIQQQLMFFMDRLQTGTKDQLSMEWSSSRFIQQQKIFDQTNGQKIAGKLYLVE